ncbi:MAG: bifunctional DNA-formamidopyrimidine glycosylase/DNA-(apurinic or apyrimidinic site) lyase [Oleiphilaceae bacterium]|nr:bifunctional DNA-formamidopyrimidine glycosylase/DNA-(apurinic or apyrimidinic site) lyase [Oleiphilaceae bacterium]
MPELPEVETTRRGIQPYMEEQLIASVAVRNPHLRWPVPSQIVNLRDQQVLQVLRRGKYIIVEVPAGALLLHLGMSGSLRVITTETPYLKHDHVDLLLSSGVRIRFNDPRRFGCCLWADDWRQHALIASLGPEPLTEEFDAAYLYAKSRGRSTSIKQFIMDAKTVVGVGNIYANEALFMAGIDPRRAAGKVSKARYIELVAYIKQVLAAAIEQGGTTLRDFVNTEGKPGYFKQQLYVYGRAGEPCKQCGTALKEVRQQQRSTVFCRVCQR